MSKLEVKQKIKKKGKTVVTVGRDLTPKEKVKKLFNKPVSEMTQNEKDDLQELLKQHMIEDTK